MRIVFMGTPEFAVASLAALLDAGKEIVAVVTAPDKPAGRGQKISESAVKQFAVSKGLPVLQPVKLKDPDFIAQLTALKPDLQVVVAFRMLPEVVWNLPPQGTINLHASLLPNYRGAAPINWAVINGEKETGVTTFKLQHEIDTGDILMQEKLLIGDTETAGELHDRMKITGAELLVQTVNDLEKGKLQASAQNSDSAIKHAPKLFKEDCEIHWNQSAKHIYNQIRGLSPYPTAFSTLAGKNLKIFKATLVQQQPHVKPGEFVTDHKTFLKFAAADGWLNLEEVQLEGKKKMGIEEFLRGIRL
jgi:methionyl-tRNA formyltransferase